MSRPAARLGRPELAKATRAAWFVLDAAYNAGFSFQSRGAGKLEIVGPVGADPAAREPVIDADAHAWHRDRAAGPLVRRRGRPRPPLVAAARAENPAIAPARPGPRTDCSRGARARADPPRLSGRIRRRRQARLHRRQALPGGLSDVVARPPQRVVCRLQQGLLRPQEDREGGGG